MMHLASSSRSAALEGDLNHMALDPIKPEKLAPSWIVGATKDLSEDQPLTVLRGYIGPSTDNDQFDANKARIYLDAGLKRYVEIPQKIAKFAVRVREESGLYYVWILWNPHQNPKQLDYHLDVGSTAIALRGYVALKQPPAAPHAVPDAAPDAAAPAEGLPEAAAPAAAPVEEAAAAAAPAAPVEEAAAAAAAAAAAPEVGKTFRLYFDVALTHYLEIHNKNFRYGVQLDEEKSPLHLCYIWIDRDASVTEHQTAVKRSYPAGLLEGLVVQDYLGGPVGADLVTGDPGPGGTWSGQAGGAGLGPWGVAPSAAPGSCAAGYGSAGQGGYVWWTTQPGCLPSSSCPSMTICPHGPVTESQMPGC
jgi:hypothetical protein